MKNYISQFPSQQRGVSTLVITILLLVIMTLIVIFSTSVGFLEQRTANNENRARLAEQAAEVGINMAGEYIKSKRENIISTGTGGWLATGSLRWITCAGTAATLDGRPHPCRSEQDATRRDQLFFYTTDGTGATIATTSVPFGTVGNVGGAVFPTTVAVQAVLCRVDSTLTQPTCRTSPAAGNRIAITFISTASINNENSSAVIKETWASFSSSSFSSALPLVASGIVKGLGNSQIVANPNAGGYGVAASMWSPNNIGFGTKSGNVCTDGSDNGAGGVGSSSTCHIEDYLFGTAIQASNVKTGCAANGAPCGCPNLDGRHLSGHTGADKAEGIDVLDIDDSFGPLPDTTFFPGTSCEGTQRDQVGEAFNDDSLFEWIFNVDVVTEGVATTKGTVSVRQNCTPNADCAVNALLVDLDATAITCAALNTLGTNATGLYYVTDAGGCTFSSQIGSATQSVIVVVEEDVDLRDNFFGLLFVRSKNNTADVHATGNNKIFGSMAVEGDINITGTVDIVYDDVSASADPTKFPKNAKFARVPGSWLDATAGF